MLKILNCKIRQVFIHLFDWTGQYIFHYTTQQTMNHIWTSWYKTYWFIIGTTPPIRVFMCIHMNTSVLPVVPSFEWVWHESYLVRTGMVSMACYHVKNLWFHCKHASTHQFFSQNPVNSRELSQLNSWIHLQNMWNHGLLFAGNTWYRWKPRTIYSLVLSLPNWRNIILVIIIDVISSTWLHYSPSSSAEVA